MDDLTVNCSETAYTVCVFYMGADGLKWGFYHGNKAEASRVWRRLEKGAHAIRLYRKRKLVYKRDADKVELVADGKEAATFFEHIVQAQESERRRLRDAGI